MIRGALSRFRLNVSKITDSLVARNVASSFIALTWLSVLSMLTIPIYVRLLGVNEWGLVAACATLQILANFLDAGFSQIVPRWVAQSAGDSMRLNQYIKFFRRIYVGMGLILLVVLQLSAGYLANEWFQVAGDSAESLELAIRIIAIQVFCQFVNTFHIGVWQGLQRQLTANMRTCVFATAKHSLTLMALILYEAHAWVYATCFAIVAALEFFVNAYSIKKLTVHLVLLELHPTELRAVLKEVYFISFGVLLGALVSHIDRIILSRALDVGAYGVYTITVTLAAAFQQLNTPLTKTYLPMFVRDIEGGEGQFSAHLKQLFLYTIMFSLLPLLLAIVYAPELLALWLRDPHVVDMGVLTLRLLLLSIVLSSLYGCIHQVILATKKSHLIVRFNLLSLFAVAVLVAMWPDKAVAELGGVIWITNTLMQLVAGLVWFGGIIRHGKPNCFAPLDK